MMMRSCNLPRKCRQESEVFKVILSYIVQGRTGIHRSCLKKLLFSVSLVVLKCLGVLKGVQTIRNNVILFLRWEGFAV